MDKVYTIPLKLLIAHHVQTNVIYFNFKFENGNALYCVDMRGKCVHDGLIVAIYKGKEYLIHPNTKIQYNGRFLRQIWDNWKNTGEAVFNRWIEKNNKLH